MAGWKSLSSYFKQIISIGILGSKAPFLKLIKYFPLDVVPSGYICKAGKFLPCFIYSHLYFIKSKASFLLSIFSLSKYID